MFNFFINLFFKKRKSTNKRVSSNFLDSESLSKIEEKLNIKLPSYYKEFHISQIELISKLRNLENDDMIYLSTNKNWLISHNYNLFEQSKTSLYLKNKFCIGTDGCGNDSFISLDENDLNIYFLDHEVEPVLEINQFGFLDPNLISLNTHSNLSKYVNNYIEIINEFIRENTGDLD